MNASAFSEPFTPRGVAAFAGAKLGRLLLAQFTFAALAAAAVAWFCYHGCFPTIQAAIENLPDNGQISSGQLNWNGAPQMLAEGGILAFDVDPEHSGQLHSTTADFQVEFGRQSVRVLSLFGYTDFPYPQNEIVQFNRIQLEPLWRAYYAVILFSIAAATFFLLPVVWWILATVYFLPAYLAGFFANRNLNLRASWRFSAAALLPGALVMIAGIVLYGSFLIGLVPFCFIFGAHFVLGWVYLVFGVAFLPRLSAGGSKANPFKKAKA